MSDALAVPTDDGRFAGMLHDGGGDPPVYSPRPYLHPVSTPGGTDISDDQPADHPWHRGLAIAVSNIDVAGRLHPVNLWGGPTYTGGQGYVQLPNNGSQVVVSTSTDADGVAQQLEWRAADGGAFLAEERSWRAGAVRAGGVDWFRLEVRSRWVALGHGPLAFGSPTTAGRPNAGYGGFFLRLAPTFDGAEIVAPDAHACPVVPEARAMGSVRTALGLRSASASVLMVPGTDNPGGPSPWFVRSTGTPMLCAAPFFHEEMTVPADGVLDWTWSLFSADGPAPDDAFSAAAALR